MQNLIKWAEVFGAEAFVYTGTRSDPLDLMDK